MIECNIDMNRCNKCQDCIRACPCDALELWFDEFVFSNNRCHPSYCSNCMDVCKHFAIQIVEE
jgi:NAD-dependent dihydropyrimidine dehydrogenase PreA subunit